ncbi:MAG TPA: hypothetical protein VMK12_27620 [Anaeromyxobacteraceae bacterium]|nr:hypothetical protein [Anaeromyxobacteraceae bacterium]
MLPQLFDALAALGPHPSLGVHAETYGRLIGSWAGEVHDHTPLGVAVGPAEIHFAWVLEGRAVQDAWIVPSRAARGQGPAPLRCRYGTTLRVFHPSDQLWRVIWLNPVSGMRNDLVGRRVGENVIHLGTRDGKPIRWSIIEIQPNAFRWQGHILEP